MQGKDAMSFKHDLPLTLGKALINWVTGDDGVSETINRNHDFFPDFL